MNTSDRVHPRKTFRVLVSPFASFQLPALNILTFHSGLLLKFIWTCSSSFSSHCDTAPLMLRSFKGSNSPTVFGLFTPLRFIHSPSCHIRTEKREIHFVRSLSHYKHFFCLQWKYANAQVLWIWSIARQPSFGHVSFAPVHVCDRGPVTDTNRNHEKVSVRFLSVIQLNSSSCHRPWKQHTGNRDIERKWHLSEAISSTLNGPHWLWGLMLTDSQAVRHLVCHLACANPHEHHSFSCVCVCNQTPRPSSPGISLCTDLW